MSDIAFTVYAYLCALILVGAPAVMLFAMAWDWTMGTQAPFQCRRRA